MLHHEFDSIISNFKKIEKICICIQVGGIASQNNMNGKKTPKFKSSSKKKFILPKKRKTLSYFLLYLRTLREEIDGFKPAKKVSLLGLSFQFFLRKPKFASSQSKTLYFVPQKRTQNVKIAPARQVVLVCWKIEDQVRHKGSFEHNFSSNHLQSGRRSLRRENENANIVFQVSLSGKL